MNVARVARKCLVVLDTSTLSKPVLSKMWVSRYLRMVKLPWSINLKIYIFHYNNITKFH